MTERPAIGVDRRTMLATGGALLAGGCAACKPPAALGKLGSKDMEIGDAHAHLFNAADLPVAGFLRNVLLPEYLDAWEPLWPALVSLAQSLKALAVPADEERKHLKGPAAHGAGEVSPQRFSGVIAREIETHARPPGIGSLDASASLADSFGLLALLLAEARGRQGSPPGPPTSQTAPGALSLDRALPVDRAFIERLAVGGASAAPASLDGALTLPGILLNPKAASQLPSLWDGVKWVYALVQPRCSHVKQYLRSMGSDRTRTVRLINLLVDYDRWVGDSAAGGSGTVEQLKFWTRYRGLALGRVAIETFAPYDPLRHAEARLADGNDDGYFAQVKRWADGTAPDIAIAGFKLYPPMGFRAKGNTGEPPENRAGLVIRKTWNDAQWPLARFGPEIETSLDRFFAFCGEKKVPILAHARNSNAASKGAGADASPLYWLDRVQAAPAPLKICLAHFSPEDPPAQWGMDAYRSVLRYNKLGPSQIFLDLAFADELLAGRAKPLLEQVAALCASDDPDCRWFMFGTDWIMLAQLHDVELYLPHLLEAASQIPFWTEAPMRLQNLLRNNLDRYLSRA